MTGFRGAAKRRTRPSHRAQTQSWPGHRARRAKRTRGGQGPATEPSHRVDRVHGRGQATELTEFRQSSGARPTGGQEEDKARPQSPATELTEFRGAVKRRTREGQGPATELTEFRGAANRRTRGGQGPATEPSHRVDRVQGRGQEEDKTQPQSPATELTEFRGAAKRRTRAGQGPATEPSHRAQPQSSATEFRGAASECVQLFSF